MITSAFARRVVGLLAAALLLGGCTHESAPPTAAPSGYYEFHDQGALYVVGSYASFEQVKAGKPPSQTVRSFGGQGEPIYFESAGPGLADQLMAEYERRHRTPR